MHSASRIIRRHTISFSETMKAVRRTTLPVLVVEEIKRDIIHGHLEVGEKFLSEKELSKRLGVGRPTAREALRIMEGQGVAPKGNRKLS